MMTFSARISYLRLEESLLRPFGWFYDQDPGQLDVVIVEKNELRILT